MKYEHLSTLIFLLYHILFSIIKIVYQKLTNHNVLLNTLYCCIIQQFNLLYSIYFEYMTFTQCLYMCNSLFKYNTEIPAYRPRQRSINVLSILIRRCRGFIFIINPAKFLSAYRLVCSL